MTLSRSLVLLAMLVTACGGHGVAPGDGADGGADGGVTGFEIRATPPDADKLRPGIDFNTLSVTERTEGSDAIVRSLPIGQATKGPYVIDILLSSKTTIASVTVELTYDAVVVKSYQENKVAITPGLLKILDVNFAAP